MKNISRRDFLKLSWNSIKLGVTSSLFPYDVVKLQSDKKSPNIVMLVCDAMSAKNLSLYGYPRKTTPNLEKISKQALVYHNHYATGSFTTPGTSSLLTGLLPWTHRAVNLSGIIKKSLSEHNLFKLLGNDYFKLAYTQNQWADFLLDQFSPWINDILPVSEFGLIDRAQLNPQLSKDKIISKHAFERMIYYSNSLLLSFINGLYYQSNVKSLQSEEYPLGYPIAQFYDYPFTLEDLFDGITNKIFELSEKKTPFFSYFHVYPPHDPYRPNKKFVDVFNEDNVEFTSKDEHTLSIGATQASLDNERKHYDAFVTNLDFEIGKLVETLQVQNILDNTYFIITSDHGEMFERGTNGHITAMLYEPVIKVPLVILTPENKTQQDFFVPTSNIDLLPTILNIANKEIPASCEGEILPGLGGVADSTRSILSMDAKGSSAFKPFSKATYTIIQGNYKLIYYSGYDHKYKDFFEFYDIQEDPEELNNKYSKLKFASLIAEMKKELFDLMNEANQKL